MLSIIRYMWMVVVGRHLVFKMAVVKNNHLAFTVLVCAVYTFHLPVVLCILKVFFHLKRLANSCMNITSHHWIVDSKVAFRDHSSLKYTNPLNQHAPHTIHNFPQLHINFVSIIICFIIFFIKRSKRRNIIPACHTFITPRAGPGDRYFCKRIMCQIRSNAIR